MSDYHHSTSAKGTILYIIIITTAACIGGSRCYSHSINYFCLNNIMCKRVYNNIATVQPLEDPNIASTSVNRLSKLNNYYV